MNQPAAAFPFLPLLLLGTALRAQDPVTLAPAQPGTSMTFEQTTVQRQVVAAQGQDMEIAQTLSQVFTIAIEAVDASATRTVKVTWSRFHGTVTLPMEDETPFDSDKHDGTAEGLQAGVLALAGMSCTAKIDGDGKVTDIQGLADTAAKARQACGDPQLAQMLDSFVGDRAVANLVRAAVGPLPKSPTAVGGKWQRSEESGNQVPMQRDLTFELRRADDKVAEIGIAGTITTRAGARGAMADAKVQDGRIEGLALFSRADSFTLRSETRTQMKIEAMGGQVQIDLMISTLLQRPPAKAPANADDKDKDAGK